MYSWIYRKGTGLPRKSKDTLFKETHLSFTLYLVNIVPFTNIISFLTTDLFDSVVAVTKLVFFKCFWLQPTVRNTFDTAAWYMHTRTSTDTYITETEVYQNVLLLYRMHSYFLLFSNLLYFAKNPGGKPTHRFHEPLMCCHLEFEKHSSMPYK